MRNKKIFANILLVLFVSFNFSCVSWRGGNIKVPELKSSLIEKNKKLIVVTSKALFDGSASFIGGQAEGKYLKKEIERNFKKANFYYKYLDNAVSDTYLITFTWDRQSATSVFGKIWAVLGWLSLYAIPWWASYNMQLTVGVYDSGKLLKEYKYMDTQTDLFQILLVLGTPFAHPNYATEKIAKDFVQKAVHDIQRDIKFM